MPAIRRRLLMVGLSMAASLRPRSADASSPLPAAPSFRLVTGDLPPFAQPGKPSGQRGVLVELTEAILQRAGYPVQAEYFPWARALLLAGEHPRTLILPLNRTPEREGRFQWLLKLYAQRFVFMTLAERPRVDGGEQARALRVGVLRGSSNVAALEQLGLPARHIVQAASIAEIHRALERHLVDAIYGSELIHTQAWQRGGRAADRLQVGMTLESADIWLAAQSGVTEDEQTRLRQQHEQMLGDGSVERIFRRYGIRPRPEDLR